MGNFTKTSVRLGIVLTILVATFALLNITPIDSVNADQGEVFEDLKGFYDGKIGNENIGEQQNNNAGGINNTNPECLIIMNGGQGNQVVQGFQEVRKKSSYSVVPQGSYRGSCNPSSSAMSSSYYPPLRD
jgi:hypothetical protein